MPAKARSSAEHKQLFLPMFSKRQIKALRDDADKRQRRNLAARERRQNRAVQVFCKPAHSGLFDAIDSTLLDMPLRGALDGNELNCDMDPVLVADMEFERARDAPHEADGNPHGVMLDAHDEPEIDWSDAAIEELHEAVLHYSLELLQARGNGKEKKEVLEWIFNPEVMTVERQSADGHITKSTLLPRSTPFSFEMCCRVCRYRPDEVRDGLVPILIDLGMGEIFKDYQYDYN